MSMIEKLMSSDTCNSGFMYYTPIKTKISQDKFNLYIKHRQEQCKEDKKKDICELVASNLEKIEEHILASEAYKCHNIKNVIAHNKWSEFKKVRVTLNEIQLLLNLLTVNNMEQVIERSVQHNNLALDDLVEFADQFLGKCSLETTNINLFICYLKEMMKHNRWYVKTDTGIYSLRDVILDKLEKEYKLIVKIASQLEDKFKNHMDEDDSSNEYIKKKNVINSLIITIAAFYNNKVISHKTIISILENLQYIYLNDVNNRYIHLELWLLLWNNVMKNIKIFERNVYDEILVWLNGQKNYVENKRLSIMIENSIENIMNDENETVNTIESFYDVEDELGKISKFEFRDFIKNHVSTIDYYVVRYLTNAVIFGQDKLKTNIDELCDCLGKDKFTKIVNDALDDEDVQCDFPKFISDIKKYI